MRGAAGLMLVQHWRMMGALDRPIPALIIVVYSDPQTHQKHTGERWRDELPHLYLMAEQRLGHSQPITLHH